MRGWNRRIVSFLHDTATNSFSHNLPFNATSTILDTAKTHGSSCRLHNFIISNQISTLPSLRGGGGGGHKPGPSLPGFKLFSTNPAVAPNITTAPRIHGASSGTGGGGGSASSAGTSWARYLLAVPPVICAGLCKWQLERRQWKIDLLERRQRIMKVIFYLKIP